MNIFSSTSEKSPKVSRRARLIASAALAAAAVVGGTQLATADPVAVPDVPAAIAVPEGNVLDSVGHAQGFQIYTCQPSGTGYAWALLQPMAVLQQEGHKAFALHYGGPSWTAMDGSTVVATKTGSAPAPSADTIPWLRLAATPKNAPAGGTFSSTTFIQRINTTGGLAPVAGCDADHIGSTQPVFYTADYYFYRAG